MIHEELFVEYLFQELNIGIVGFMEAFGSSLFTSCLFIRTMQTRPHGRPAHPRYIEVYKRSSFDTSSTVQTLARF